MSKITADQTRRARRTLGITQAKLATETGINPTLIKHFETYRIDNPPQDIQQTLLDYFNEKGVDPSQFESTDKPSASTAKSGSGIVKSVSIPRMSFLVSDKLSDADLSDLLDRMDTNDERIHELLQTKTKKVMFGNYSEPTIAESRELFALLAENYLLFRHMQGRNLFDQIESNGNEETHGHMLRSQVVKSPVAEKLISPIKPSPEAEETQQTEEEA